MSWNYAEIVIYIWEVQQRFPAFFTHYGVSIYNELIQDTEPKAL